MEVNKLGMEICNISSFHISHTQKKHPEVCKTIHERRFFNATITKVSDKLLVYGLVSATRVNITLSFVSKSYS